ncbi:hypothetical protein RSAG8_09584, partial [Rhizoctonia solani AG-8 WAC10335]
MIWTTVPYRQKHPQAIFIAWNQTNLWTLTADRPRGLGLIAGTKGGQIPCRAGRPMSHVF